jgi:hypothetical protein
MLKVTGTTAVTAGLGTLVLLNAISTWGTQRTEPQTNPDLPSATSATLDPAIALQLRSGAWRHWPARTADPAAIIARASSPPQTPPPSPAAQPNLPVASLAEPPPARDRAMPGEQLTPPTVLPPPQQGTDAASPSPATPSGSLNPVSRPLPGKDRMLLAGPVSEPTASEEQDGSRARLTGPPSEPPQADPPGNIGALPANRFGPDSFRRFERNGF